jgi:hypothetical protein
LVAVVLDAAMSEGNRVTRRRGLVIEHWAVRDDLCVIFSPG